LNSQDQKVYNSFLVKNKGEGLRLKEGYNQDLDILADVIRSLNQASKLEEIYSIALGLATRLNSVQMVMIYLVNEEKRQAVLEAHKNVPQDYVRQASRIPFAEGLTWKAIQAGKVMYIEDILEEPDAADAFKYVGSRNLLGIPVRIEQKTIGLIWFISYIERKFDEVEIKVLSMVGDLLVTAIAKAKQTEEFMERNKYLSILSEISQQIHKSVDLNQVFQTILELTRDLKFVDLLSVYLVEEYGNKKEAVLQIHQGYPAEYLEKASRIPYGTGITWEVISKGEPHFYEDASASSAPTGPAGKALGARALLSIPIKLDGDSIGTVDFSRYEKNSFNRQELDFLLSLGNQIGTAIAKAKITEEMKRRREALRQSEERYKDLFENVPSGIYRTTPEGRILMANPALVRMLGYSSFDELVSRNLEEEGFDVNYPRSRFKELIEQKSEISGLESAWVKQDGSLVYVLESTRAVRGEDGTVLYYEGTVENITERKRAEDKLREREEQLRLLTDALPVCISYIDAQERYLFNNKAYEKWFGCPREEITGKHMKEILGEDVYAKLKDKVEIVLSGQAITFDSIIPHKDAEAGYVNVSYVPHFDDHGQVKGFYALILDITDRMRVEKALRESLAQLSKKNRYETIISSVAQSVHKSINLEDVLENAVEAMSKNIDKADIVGIYLVEGEEAVLKVHKGLTNSYIERAGRIPYPRGLTWKTIMEGKPIYCADVKNDNFLGPAGRELGIKSYLSMPINFEGKTVGTMGINSFEKNAFNDEELNLLEIVVRQIEVAINNAKKVESLRRSEEALRKARNELEIRVQERTAELATANKALQAEIVERRAAEYALRESLAQLSKKNRYEAIISEVTRSVHQSINLQEVLENAVEVMSDKIDRVDNVAIYLVEGQQAVLKAYKGFNDRYIERAGRIAYPKGITWKTIMEGKPRYVSDVDKDTILGPAGRELGIKSYLSMPVSFQGKTIGALILTSFEKNAFDEEELRLLEIVAQQIIAAIKNARQAESLQESKEELEKRVQERTLELSRKNEELRKEILWRVQAEKALRVSEEKYRTLVEHTYDLIAETTIDGRFLYVSPKHKDALGYEAIELIGTKVFEYIYPDDLPAVMEEFAKATKTISSGSAVFRFKHKDGNWLWLESTGKPYRTEKGEIRGVIASRDITERKRVDEQIKESLREKEVLLKEIHHRVKNNLQVISSLINIQSQYTKSRKALEMFNETQNRIRSMALIHEQLYQSNNMAMISFSEYVQNLLANLFYSYDINPDAIKLKVNVDNIFLNIDTAIPCGLIINELVSNSMKHAFPRGRKGEIRVEMLAGNGMEGKSAHPYFTLIVSDNGCSLPKDLDLRNTNSLGLQLVLDLVEQLGGIIEVDRNAGASFKIKFEEL
jgi:PAS domain S-box-containing protein